jgi:hypothetical protein
MKLETKLKLLKAKMFMDLSVIFMGGWLLGGSVMDRNVLEFFLGVLMMFTGNRGVALTIPEIDVTREKMREEVRKQWREQAQKELEEVKETYKDESL